MIHFGCSIVSDHSVPLSSTQCYPHIQDKCYAHQLFVLFLCRKYNLFDYSPPLGGQKVKTKSVRIPLTLFTEHNRLSAGYCKQSGKIQITGPGSLLLCCFGTQATNPSPQLSSGIWRDECWWAGSASESWCRQQSANDGGGRPATGTDTDQTIPMCQSRQLSVWRRRRWLIIDRLRLCCFPHTFSAFLFPLPPRLDRGCDMKSRQPVFGNVTSLFFSSFFSYCNHHT